MYKACTKCSREKPLDDYYSDKRAKDGKQSQCKSCHKGFYQTYHGKSVKKKSYDPQKRSDYYQDNKDRVLERGRQYYQETKEQKLAYGKQHYQQNKSKYAEYTLSLIHI